MPSVVFEKPSGYKNVNTSAVGIPGKPSSSLGLGSNSAQDRWCTVS